MQSGKAKSRRNTKVGRGYLQNAYVYMGEAFRGTHSTEDIRLVRLDVAAAHHRRCLAALRPGVLATWRPRVRLRGMKRSAFLGISEPKSTRRAVLRSRWNAASDDSDDAKRTAVIRSISMHSCPSRMHPYSHAQSHAPPAALSGALRTLRPSPVLTKNVRNANAAPRSAGAPFRRLGKR